MKNLLVFVACSISLTLLAVSTEESSADPRKGAIGKVVEEKFGGYVRDPKSGHGSVVFLNSQSLLEDAQIERVIATIQKVMHQSIFLERSESITSLPTISDVTNSTRSVAIYVIDAQNFPDLLAAPDECWALVNIRKIKDGVDKDGFKPGSVMAKKRFESRCRGQLLRAFGLACGAGSSHYKGNLFGITSTSGIDRVDPDGIAYDVVQRCTEHLRALDVTAVRYVLYNAALKEGFAPPATNDVQRKIVEDFKKKPSKPLKITPGQLPAGK